MLFFSVFAGDVDVFFLYKIHFCDFSILRNSMEMLNSRSSICSALIIFYRMAIIHATKYYYKESGQTEFKFNDTMEHLFGKELQVLKIDLRSTRYLFGVNLDGETSYLNDFIMDH